MSKTKKEVKKAIKQQIGAKMSKQKEVVNEVANEEEEMFPKIDLEKLDRTRSARRDALSSTQEALAETLKHLGFIDHTEDPNLLNAVKSLQNAVRYLSRTTDLVNDFTGNMLMDLVNLYRNIKVLQINLDKIDQKSVVALSALKMMGMTDEQFKEIFETLIVPQYMQKLSEQQKEQEELPSSEISK